MPTKTIWVEPEIFMTHNGVNVFHTYVDDDIDQGPVPWRFTTNPTSDDESFDVREFLSVPGHANLGEHPPFLSSSSNPAYATASLQQIDLWEQQWMQWHAPGGTRDQSVQNVLKNAIDQGLITPHTDRYDGAGQVQSAAHTKRCIFAEALLARQLATTASPRMEEIRIRRDVVAAEVLNGYPFDMVITRYIYDADDVLQACLIAMDLHFELPTWEGRTVGEFRNQRSMIGTSIDTNVIQHGQEHFNADGVRAHNITLGHLKQAQPLDSMGWLMPTGQRIWFHAA